ncbi:uncharacterized protein HMPREF1541_04750 [Cyphellophora europaea CBS 101466]|uniref:Enoyl reductase (ER) domain-containing protein n=1 Tax=Cyphellophora europaea (strain CBS 101466) TaxID=1220924 RepID=W2RXH8_CYPE1|nr:uncharacterized protein HMPREF1541_04750 [Cyphellophora europaea CBS 101466]ETN40473.1 hypothetical protein HMPREF1541_04750 [Cyphellophora europaea CBS 101466]
MKGVICEKGGAGLKVVDDLQKPKPGPDQLLVKSLYIGLAPVDKFMIDYGQLVDEWPVTLGADGSGKVVELGENAGKYGFEVGDYVFGCVRLGKKGHGQGQEYFLKEAPVTFKKPEKLTIIQAATIGAGASTAGLGVWEGLNVAFPGASEPSPKDEWAIVFGGAGSVGRAAVQVLLLAGYKVATTCSSRSKKDLEQLGAVPVDYKQPEADQVEEFMRVTGGKFCRIFDATSADDPTLAKELFKRISGDKYFATTNDWPGPPDFEGGKTYHIELGPIGNPEATKLNEVLKKHIPVLTKYLADGRLTTPEYEVFGEGFEAAVNAYAYQSSGKGGNKKVVVKVQDE